MNKPTNEYSPVGKYKPIHKGVTAKPANNRHARRSLLNDYRAKGYYLITAVANPDIDFIPFSSMPLATSLQLKGGNMIIPKHSLLGSKINDEILAISTHHPEIKIIRYVIMPDHIHLVLEVKETLRRHLGNELAGFFGACSKHYNQITGSANKTLFDPFHDRIIKNHTQLDRAIKYVEDNARRYIIKKRNPQIFKTYLNIKIDGRIFSAYGNLFLLRNISLLPVRVHRKWKEQDFNDYEDFCRTEIERGAIPISPSIHKAEKKILEMAIEMGASVIKLRDKGFGEKFKPQGKEFDLCAEGRLLLLAPCTSNISGKSTSGYMEFHDMNDMASAISKLTASTRMSIMEASTCLKLAE